MLAGKIANIDQLDKEGLSAKVVRALEELKELSKQDPSQLKEDKYELGEGIFYYIQKYETKDPKDAGPKPPRFESHMKYIDIQALLHVEEGEGEMMGHAPIIELTPSDDYDSGSDVIHYHTPDSFKKVKMQKGDYAILYPEDGHMPKCHYRDTPSKVVKAVFKVPID